MTDRITFDGDMDHLDEVVMTGVTVHIEALDAHGYMIAIYADDGRILHLHGLNVAYAWSEGVDDLIQVDPPLLGCMASWPRGPLAHACYNDKGHEGRHRCDCGSVHR